ncbi:MAG: excinuclease ABC subunit UvrA, partial [Acidobacteria bacterium]|nr:excinuclease ABC subunit UvrA [Acidobacteriota bacterium]
EQKTTSRNPRSTVGTVTEIYDYMRLLFSSIGIPHCQRCGRRISRQSTEQILDQILQLPERARVMILAPVVRERKGEFKKQFEKYLKEGFLRARVDGRMASLDEEISLDKRKKHTVEIVVDRLLIQPGIRRRLEQSVQAAMVLTEGLVTVAVIDGDEQLYSQKLGCVDCGINIPALEPRSFSFNSRAGACLRCGGLGSQLTVEPGKLIADPQAPLEKIPFTLEDRSTATYLREALLHVARHFGLSPQTPWDQLPRKARETYLFGTPEPFTYHYGRYRYTGRFDGINRWLQSRYDESRSEARRQELQRVFARQVCVACHGARLRPESLAVQVGGRSIADYCALPLDEAHRAFSQIRLAPREHSIAGQILKEICDRLQFMMNVGLGYLTLDRSAATLSGGEGQRIRLATQIGSRLRGVLYVLDEPSIGLHPRDNGRLLETLQGLRQLGNTIVVVEHDEETIRTADHIVDLGPGAGSGGGHVVAAGDLKTILNSEESLTGKYLSGALRIEVPKRRHNGNGKHLVVRGAQHHNLKNIDVDFPLGLFLCVTGVSGSGKSSLVDEIVYRALAKKLHRAALEPGSHRSIHGIHLLDKVIEIDQSPIGRTPRSNPATYAGLFTPIRELFALLPESRARGYRPGRFSFNVKGGRCDTCLGEGLRKIEMNFLPDVYVNCETCRGSRYNKETLAVKYKGYSIADILNLTISDALPVLENIPQIQAKLQTLMDVGLGYIRLGQPATTLSGGEAQRVKLAKELSRRSTGKTLYILDEPTTGLHFDDVKKLLDILHRLVDLGNTVIVTEHNLDVIKTADWIIDLGPEGGEGGGRLVAEGPPEAVSRIRQSHTGRALNRILQDRRS